MRDENLTVEIHRHADTIFGAQCELHVAGVRVIELVPGAPRGQDFRDSLQGESLLVYRRLGLRGDQNGGVLVLWDLGLSSRMDIGLASHHFEQGRAGSDFIWRWRR